MILLAFSLPVALYLILLGVLNRRPSPVLVPGTWDFIGLLFAASGFLLFGGPGILSGLNERWRLFWLFGQPGASFQDGEGHWPFWIFLSALYFLMVVVGSGFLLWRQRRLTAIYNVERLTVESILAQVCADLGTHPLRAAGPRNGELFLFGVSRRGSTEQVPIREGVQGPHYLSSVSTDSGGSLVEALPGQAGPAREFPDQTAVLELDSFPLLRHVTLRWDPADSPLRREIEGELCRRFARTPAAGGEVGAGLLLLGLFLLALTFLGGVVLLFLRLLGH